MIPEATVRRREWPGSDTTPSVAASTIIQPSAVHTGLTDDPAGELKHLFETLVR